MIVADANLLAYLVVEGAHTPAALAVARRDDAWAAPRLWRSELMSTLGGYVRRGESAVAGALKRFAVAELAIGDREFDAEPADVLELAARSGCSTYDCEYVAVARALGVPRVTADKQILGAFPRIAVSPEDFVKR
ncbi:MAG: type II toxin-antitoxin system VapC family toxin [Gemmatimonadota bacterium]